MHVLLAAAALLVATIAPAVAQNWAPWHQPNLLDMYGSKKRSAPPPPPEQAQPRPPRAPSSGGAVPAGLSATPGGGAASAGPVVLQGGPRPGIQPKAPEIIGYRSGQPPGTIVIDSARRRLYLVRSASEAYVYPVSVGREGFSWNGSERISRIASWPDWHPPAEMRERDPRLPTKMTGGVRNPLGAKALYLGSTLYRIHGTSDARSIGRAASSGCFRMHNSHVVDLATRVRIGTKVVVINAPKAPRTAAAGTGPTTR